MEKRDVTRWSKMKDRYIDSFVDRQMWQIDWQMSQVEKARCRQTDR